MDPTALSRRLLRELRAAGDPDRAAHDARYLRSDLQHWGVPVPAARAVARSAGRRLPAEEVLATAGLLWDAGPYDARLCAALLLDLHADVLRASELPLLEALVRQSGTWALTDVLAPRPLAAIDTVDRQATTAALDRWVGQECRWLRRAALLAHLLPLRAGLSGWPRFTGYAEELLEDRDPFVRKAIGWVLREVARHDPDLVRDWVGARVDRISGLALREAVRPLPPEDAARLICAHRQGRRRTGG